MANLDSYRVFRIQDANNGNCCDVINAKLHRANAKEINLRDQDRSERERKQSEKNKRDYKSRILHFNSSIQCIRERVALNGYELLARWLRRLRRDRLSSRRL